MTDQFAFACPHCRARLSAPRRSAGLPCTCPCCDGRLTAPVAAAGAKATEAVPVTALARDPSSDPTHPFGLPALPDPP